VFPDGTASLFAGAVALGLVHGVEPGHGWPVAASYAVDRSNRWFAGLAASTLLGVGHLVSSVAVVLVFFFAKSYFSLTQANEPLSLWGVQVGGPVDVVAGVLLVALGIREYRHGHYGHGGDGEGQSRDGPNHGEEGTMAPGADPSDPKFATGHAHSEDTHTHGGGHEHDGHGHPHGDGDGDGSHGHGHSHGGGLRAAILRRVPFLEEARGREAPDDRGLWGLRGSPSCWGSPTRRSSR
jgi:nickel/cobalt exporter